MEPPEPSLVGAAPGPEVNNVTNNGLETDYLNVSQPVADEFHVQDNAPLGTETATRAAIIQIDWSMMLRHVAQRLVKSETQ